MRTVKKVVSLAPLHSAGALQRDGIPPLVYLMYQPVGGGGDLSSVLKFSKMLQSEGFRVCVVKNPPLFSEQSTSVLSKLQAGNPDIPIYTLNSVPETMKDPKVVVCFPVIKDASMWADVLAKISKSVGREIPAIPVQEGGPSFYVPPGGKSFGVSPTSIGLLFPTEIPVSLTHETFSQEHPEHLESLENKWLLSCLTEGGRENRVLGMMYHHLSFNSVRSLLVMAASLAEDGRDIDCVLHTWDRIPVDHRHSEIPKSLYMLYDPNLTFFEQLSWYRDSLRECGISNVVFSYEDPNGGVIEQRFDVSEPKGNKTLRLFDPFPLSPGDMERLGKASMGPKGCTGINSLIECIVMGGLPMYEALHINGPFWKDFCAEAKQFYPENKGLARYLELNESLVKYVKYGYDKTNPSSDGQCGFRRQIPVGVGGDNSSVDEIAKAQQDIMEVGELIRSPLLWEQHAQFSKHLIENRNANKGIMDLITARLSLV